jgi:hypothetical protein
LEKPCCSTRARLAGAGGPWCGRAGRRAAAAGRSAPDAGGAQGARSHPHSATRRVCVRALAMRGALHCSGLTRGGAPNLRGSNVGIVCGRQGPRPGCALCWRYACSRCARLRPLMLVLHVSAACALAVRTRCCACPCCAFPCCAPSCWACCVLVQRSSRRIVRISLVNVVDIAGVYRPWRCTCLRCARLRFPYSRYFSPAVRALALPVLALLAPAVRALALRACAVRLRAACAALAYIVRRSLTSPTPNPSSTPAT